MREALISSRSATAARRAGTLLPVLAALGLVGCAPTRPLVPLGELRSRVLPPPSASPVAATEPVELVDDPTVASGETSPTLPESAPAERWTLPEAIELALRSNPRLALEREKVEMARGGRSIAFAGFLPEASTSLRHIEGSPSHERFGLPTLPTAVGNVTYGGLSDSFQLAELHVQWTLWDFGRTGGAFGRASAELEFAELLYQRARQTVAFNVTAAYLGALDARARRVIAQEAVRRAESHLGDGRNYLARGTIDKNDLYLAELLVARMRLDLVTATTAESVALVALNHSVGVNGSRLTSVVNVNEGVVGGPADSLADALARAIDQRAEFPAALSAIVGARHAARAASAEFLPKVLIGGTAAQLDGTGIGQRELVSGGLNLELGLFAGGRRIAADRVARSEIRAAIARARDLCDTISYEVNAAWLALVDARQRMALSDVEVLRATENLRVYRRRYAQGDAKPTDVVDAELAMTRAAQGQCTALYDNQIALARLAYAVGSEILTASAEKTPESKPVPDVKEPENGP